MLDLTPSLSLPTADSKSPIAIRRRYTFSFTSLELTGRGQLTILGEIVSLGTVSTKKSNKSFYVRTVRTTSLF